MGAILVNVSRVATVPYVDKGKKEGGHSGPLLNVAPRMLADRRWGLRRLTWSIGHGCAECQQAAGTLLPFGGERLSRRGREGRLCE